MAIVLSPVAGPAPVSSVPAAPAPVAPSTEAPQFPQTVAPGSSGWPHTPQ
jgi:hypothetical protein